MEKPEYKTKLKVMKRIFILLSLFAITISGTSDIPCVEGCICCRVYKAFITNDMNIWKQGIASKQNKFKAEGKTCDLYELTLAQYGLTAYYLGKENYDAAKKYLPILEKNIELLIADKNYKSRGKALKGAMYGFKVALNPLKGVYLGTQSLDLINEAVITDPSNPTGWVEKGNAKYHMPAIFGGSYEDAITYYKKAIVLFEKQRKCIKCNWLYLNTLVWLAKSYDQDGKLSLAKQTYEKVLRVEPGFTWVKNELLPDIKKKIQEENR